VSDVRTASYAGTWYPGTVKELQAQLDEYLLPIEAFAAPSKIRSLVSPHAGYSYSGATAGYAYKGLDPNGYKTVVVLAPSHREALSGVAPWSRGAFETPLGMLAIDEEFCEKVFSGWDAAHPSPLAHRLEHSLEMQLPFLQRVLLDFALVPILTGEHSLDFARELADRLKAAIGEREDVLVVASTDLSHFHQAEIAEQLDGVASQCIENLDVEGLWKAARAGTCELCGLMPVLTVLSMSSARESAGSKVLKYTHSGSMTGDLSSVVGYLSAIQW